MDKGEWLKKGFYVRPVSEGSYILHESSIEMGSIGRARAFSNLSDLVDFINDDARALIEAKGASTPEKEQ